MAIERMQHVALLTPAGTKAEAVKWLYARREMHVLPFERGEACPVVKP